MENQQPNQQVNSPPPVNRESTLIRIFYPIQNLLKLYFIIASIFLISYTDVIGLIICIIAVLRILKAPKFNQQYLAKLLQNQFGISIFYVMMSFPMQGPKNYLFFAPLSIHFFLGIIEYINIKLNHLQVVKNWQNAINIIRENRFNLLVVKGKLEFLFFIVTLILVPLHWSRIITAVLLFQYVIIKHKLSPEFKYAIYDVNTYCKQNTRFPGISYLYDKLCDLLAKL